MPRLDRRAALRVFGIGGSALLLAACNIASQPNPSAVTASPPPSTGTTPSAAATSQPKLGGTLRYAQASSPVSIDGNSIAGGGSETGWLVFDRLTTYDLNRNPQPMLAESWDIGSDFKQFKLNLRKSVQFHSGRELTSDDVKYTFLRTRDASVGSGILAGFSNWFTTIDLPDKYTVVLGCDSPRPTFFDAIELFNIVDKQNTEGPDAQSKIVGTGPFTFVEYQNGDHFSVAKNQNYWRSGEPRVDGVTTFIRGQSTMGLQLESGALDIIKGPSVDDFVRLRDDPNYQAIIHPAAGWFYEVGFNTARPPFDDKRVRQAFNYAIDRQRFTDTIMRGTAQPISLPWDKSSPAYDPSRNSVYAYDLDRARSLLNDAGVTNLATDILVIGAASSQMLSFSQILQDSLKTLGVTLNIKNLESSVWVDVVINKKPDYTGLWVSGDQIAQLSPSTLFQLSPGWRLDNNHSAFKSDQWTMLVTSLLSETNPDKQKQLYANLNDYILDQSFTVAFSTNPYTFLMRNNVMDVGYLMHNGGLNLQTAWLG
jgi:peptide/nickel transport system substrate-binding protein